MVYNEWIPSQLTKVDGLWSSHWGGYPQDLFGDCGL